jgi:peptidoglycan-associated lipoprotein
MRFERPLTTLAALGLLAALAAGCASPAKAVKPTTDTVEGATATVEKPAPAPEAAPQPPAPPRQACSLDRVHFAFDSAVLDDAAREELKQAAACLAERRPADVLIEGHCDERGTVAYNLALGNRRAAGVKVYLGDLGATTPLRTISFGKELPLAKGHDESAWSQNRRAELKLPGEKRSDGGLTANR